MRMLSGVARKTRRLFESLVKGHLIDMFERECLFEHPKILELLVLLIRRSRESAELLSEIFACYMDPYNEDSLVLLGANFARKTNDEEIELLCDEIKMFTL